MDMNLLQPVDHPRAILVGDALLLIACIEKATEGNLEKVQKDHRRIKQLLYWHTPWGKKKALAEAAELGENVARICEASQAALHLRAVLLTSTFRNKDGGYQEVIDYVRDFVDTEAAKKSIEEAFKKK